MTGYLHVKDQPPNPKRMCRRGCIEYPDGQWALCAWHEGRAQWAATNTHRHDRASCPQCAALVRTPETLDVEWLALSAAARLEGEVSRLRTALANCTEAYAATPSPTPPEGLRAARYDSHGGPWFPDSPQEWLDAALDPFRVVAESEASRPRADDGHRVGPGDLAVSDWRRLAAALRASPAPDPGAGLREAIGLIEELVRYLHPWTSMEQGGEVELLDRVQAFLGRWPAPSAEPPETA